MKGYGVSPLMLQANLDRSMRAVFSSVSVVLGRKLKLTILLNKKVCEKAKRLFEIPDVMHYALADGIYRLLFGQKAVFHETAPLNTGQIAFSVDLIE